jgi:FKBP-type peptidyl-prolyl cis-trans isomerase 2
MGIQKGDKVKLQYVGKLEDGTIFDKGVTEFEVGEGFIVKGLEEEVVGMEKGERRKFVLPPEKAFGDRREGFKKVFSKRDFERRQFNKGDPIRVRTKSGQIAHCLVDEITEDEMIVDLNHPLAGETLEFEVEVLKVN